MLKFKIPEEQYVLSLDSLDLNFLSQYVQKPSDEERLLWSKSVKEDSAFYQVEIVSEEEADQDENSFIEPYESYQCYICNIDVPKKYYKQHNKSARHQNHKMLVEKVLENVRKQMNTDVDSVPNNLEYDMFYCETCCKVVTRNNIRNHKKSNYHIQSIENEQLTSKFIEMYINNNKEDDIQSEINYENDLDSELSSPSYSDWCDDTNANSNSENNRHNSIPYKGKNCNGIEEIENFQKYLKDMVVKYKLDVKLPSVADDSVVIVTPIGHKEHITTDAFHSYKEMNGFVFCLLCEKWVQENVKEHSVSEEHVRNIFQPINDNFAREMVNDKQYSHCLICNERFLTTSKHVGVKPKHKKYLHQSALNSKECDTNPESFSEMKSNSTSYEEPNLSYLSKTAIDSSLPNTDLETVEEKLKVYRKQFKLVNATTLQCLVCSSTNVINVDNNIITHVEGKLHSKACTLLLRKSWFLTKISMSVYKCILCNISTDNFIHHSKIHVKKSKSGSKKNFIKYVYEDPLNVSPEAIQCRKMYEDCLKINHIVKTSENRFNCEICLLKMCRISEIDHMFGLRHRLNFYSTSNAS